MEAEKKRKLEAEKIDIKNVDKFIINKFIEIIKRKPTNTEYRLFKSMIKKGKTKSWVIDNINNINNPIKIINLKILKIIIKMIIKLIIKITIIK